jgi:hypothetical protein
MALMMAALIARADENDKRSFVGLHMSSIRASDASHGRIHFLNSMRNHRL